VSSCSAVGARRRSRGVLPARAGCASCREAPRPAGAAAVCRGPCVTRGSTLRTYDVLGRSSGWRSAPLASARRSDVSPGRTGSRRCGCGSRVCCCCATRRGSRGCRCRRCPRSAIRTASQGGGAAVAPITARDRVEVVGAVGDVRLTQVWPLMTSESARSTCFLVRARSEQPSVARLGRGSERGQKPRKQAEIALAAVVKGQT